MAIDNQAIARGLQQTTAGGGGELLVVLIGSCLLNCIFITFTMSNSNKSVTYLPDVIKGDADYRSYRPLLLDNGITVLLANDPQSKHFAASVSVHAGASSDPRGLPGLAHFCEHMCFLGSKAYPEENEVRYNLYICFQLLLFETISFDIMMYIQYLSCTPMY